MPSKSFCNGVKPCKEHRVLDVLSEIIEKRKEMREFFTNLDNSNLLFKDYVQAVMDKYNCDGNQAGKMISKHMKGDY